jgi:hypothetical protein
VNTEAGALQIEIFPRQDGKEWSISLDDFEGALKYARVRLQPKRHLETGTELS